MTQVCIYDLHIEIKGDIAAYNILWLRISVVKR